MGSVVISGGVAANQELRKQLREVLNKRNLPLYNPELKLCTDNAAMIGAVAYYQYQKNDFSDLSLNADPNLSL